jgi:arylformamidase
VAAPVPALPSLRAVFVLPWRRRPRLRRVARRTTRRVVRRSRPRRWLRLAAGAVALPVLALGAGCGEAARSAAGDAPDCGGPGAVHPDLRYAQDAGVAAAQQSLDLYLPAGGEACGPVPVVVYVHGGGFRRGDKSHQAEAKADLFTGEGWAFASVNYRLVGDDDAGPDGATYPRAEQDVARAVAFLRDQAARYGLDPGNVMLLGHSAGGFLVALVGTDATFLEEAAPGAGLGAVTCVAPLDTSYDIPANVEAGGRQADMFTEAFGDDPEVWRRASPTHVVTASGDGGGAGLPAFHVVTRGGPARVAESRAFARAVGDAGGTAALQVARGLSHAEVNHHVGGAGDTVVTPALLRFYRGCVAWPWTG